MRRLLKLVLLLVVPGAVLWWFFRLRTLKLFGLKASKAALVRVWGDNYNYIDIDLYVMRTGWTRDALLALDQEMLAAGAPHTH